MKRQALTTNLLALLIGYSLLVFLWGAWVRISGSGDGCGEHWPLCYGVLLPESSELVLLIENAHRLSTKLYGFWVLGLVGLIFASTTKPHAARKWILYTLLFTLIEGLIGAIIVLKGLVTDDDSLFRAAMMSIHLANTFLLMASLVTCWFVCRFDLADFKLHYPSTRVWNRLAVGLVIIGALGALAALSTTLFPSTSLLEGLKEDFAADSHFLLKIRILHPILATATLGFVLIFAPSPAHSSNFSHRCWRGFVLVFVANVLIGFLTLGLLSPTVLKLLHLLLGHLLWIFLVGFILEQMRLGNNSREEQVAPR